MCLVVARDGWQCRDDCDEEHCFSCAQDNLQLIDEGVEEQRLTQRYMHGQRKLNHLLDRFEDALKEEIGRKLPENLAVRCHFLKFGA